MTSEYDPEKANKRFIQISKKYGLNPVLLKDIMILRNKGFNNAQISQKTGINRNTVNKYVNALNEMQTEDFASLLVLIGIIAAGAIIVGKLLDSLLGDNNR